MSVNIGAGETVPGAQFGDTTLPDWVIEPARRTVASNARNADDALMLLQMLGLADTPTTERANEVGTCAGTCGRPTRPPRSDAGMYPPGTIEIAARGMCQSCYSRDRKQVAS